MVRPLNRRLDLVAANRALAGREPTGADGASLVVHGRGDRVRPVRNPLGSGHERQGVVVLRALLRCLDNPGTSDDPICRSVADATCRVAAGAVAKKILDLHHIKVIAYTLAVAGIYAKKKDFAAIEKNLVRAPDMDAAGKMIAKIEEARLN